MYIDVNGIKTFYRQEGEGKDLLLLHGWGGSNDSFAPVFNSLKKHFRVTAVDFWGFGKSGLPPDGVDTFWYADMLDEFLKTGFLGCPECYDAFSDQMQKILPKIQGKTRHVPRKHIVLSPAEQVADLKAQLDAATCERRYDEAEKIYRKLKEMGEI